MKTIQSNTRRVVSALGALAVLASLASCGVRGISDSESSQKQKKGQTPCPEVAAPDATFCPGGTVKEVLDDAGCKSFVCEQAPVCMAPERCPDGSEPTPVPGTGPCPSYVCGQNPACPQVAAPDASFCPNGAAHLDTTTCNWVCNCPLYNRPECLDGHIEVDTDDFGCVTDIRCVPNATTCPVIAAPDATFCPGGTADIYLNAAGCNAWYCAGGQRCPTNVAAPRGCTGGTPKPVVDPTTHCLIGYTCA